MKKIISLGIIALLCIDFSGCAKNNNSTCKKCQAKCGTTKIEQTICSPDDQNAFINEHSGCDVECE